MYDTAAASLSAAENMVELSKSSGIINLYDDPKLIHAYTELYAIVSGDPNYREYEPEPSAMTVFNVNMMLPILCNINGSKYLELECGCDAAIIVSLFSRYKARISVHFNDDNSITMMKAIDTKSDYKRIDSIKDLFSVKYQHSYYGHQFLQDAIAEYHEFNQREPELKPNRALYYYNYFTVLVLQAKFNDNIDNNELGYQNSVLGL